MAMTPKNLTAQKGSFDPASSHADAMPGARDLDPNVLQRQASHPQKTIWVNASAGTGKTKVLTDRVLRLLLPMEGREASPVHKILCLTFTKAAASEMELRLFKTLSRWTTMAEEDLITVLKKLLGQAPSLDQIRKARQLFTDVIDAPNGGLQIMTLHSFCQSVLARFPLEAGLKPGFQPLEDYEAETLLVQAQKEALAQAASAPDGSPSKIAYRHLAHLANDEQLQKLLRTILSERRQVQTFLKENWDEDGLYTALCRFLNIRPGGDHENISSHIFKKGEFPDTDMKRALQFLLSSTAKTDKDNAQRLENCLYHWHQGITPDPDAYARVFLTQEGTARKTLITKSLQKQDPAVYETVLESMSREAERILTIMEYQRKAQCAAATRDLFLIGKLVIERYQSLKRYQNALDFDDLILQTVQLLGGGHDVEKLSTVPLRAWVLYKLDQGLDHILIDEAQDTNPEQWMIIEALCDEFFAGLNAHDDVTRTLFTVGDEKQSIYSFQRASPEAFQTMRTLFAARTEQAGQSWAEVDLNVSFRSSESVLRAVDAVFAQPALKGDPGFDAVSHMSFRKGQAGRVELWPLFETEDVPPFNPWDPPITVTDVASGAMQCANHIAQTIKDWIATGRRLPSHDRAVRPGDIMILLRSRSAFMNQLILALKQAGLPVSGHDRMVIQDQIAVQDLMALADFCLLPGDDLALACVLKSPLIGLSEEGLFKVCSGRGGSVWQSLLEKGEGDKRLGEIVRYLSRMKEYSRQSGPYDFFSFILNGPCPASAVSGWHGFARRLGRDCFDALEEYLNLALSYENRDGTALQGFIQSQKHDHTVIKREQEEAGDTIRIMTVHGSKGLQAPVVILPDTVRAMRSVPGQNDKRLLLPDKTGVPVPLWSPRKDMDCEEFTSAYDMLEGRADEEYRRLLYVAMTRAEDELYVTGYAPGKKPIEDSWYYYIEGGLKSCDSAVLKEDGRIELTNPQIDGKAPDRVKEDHLNVYDPPMIPRWAYSPAPVEPSPPRPLMPSRPSGQDAIFHPVLKDQMPITGLSPIQRGIIIHKLLQFLPDFPPQERKAKADIFLEHVLPEQEAAEEKRFIIHNVLNVLDDPAYAMFFAEGSKAEVPITGMVDAQTLISGQIDRLRIDHNRGEIWVVDYKSAAMVPQSPDDIPQAYYRQMAGYRALLQTIYPDYTITTGLLWTAAPVLTVLDV